MGIVLALLILAGCNSSPTEPVNSQPVREASVVLQHGQASQVSSDLRVSFAQLLEDSRCPASVACVWQGNGAIRLEVTIGGSAHSVRLNTAGGDAFPREASVGGYTFTLVTLDPQRQTTDAVPVQQYRATIRVTRD